MIAFEVDESEHRRHEDGNEEVAVALDGRPSRRDLAQEGQRVRQVFLVAGDVMRDREVLQEHVPGPEIQPLLHGEQILDARGEMPARAHSQQVAAYQRPRRRLVVSGPLDLRRGDEDTFRLASLIGRGN